MAAPLTGSMPQFTNLSNGTTVSLEALDPTTMAPVTGVDFVAVEIWADVGDTGPVTLDVPPPLLTYST